MSHTSTSKIRVTLTVEVDRDAWEEAYGSGDGQPKLHEDVRAYVLQAIQESGAAEEQAIVSVVLR